jgi:hypothetical protein
MNRRVMYILATYPQISQTYIRAELRALSRDSDIKIVVDHPPNLPYEDHMPYEIISEEDGLLRAIEEFRPDVIHTHYLHMVRKIGPLAEKTGIPFTVRTHSFDVLASRVAQPGVQGLARKLARTRGLARFVPSARQRAMRFVNDDHCLGVLVFPFVRPLLEQYGARPDKLVDCFPVIDYAAFHDEGPNGDAVMNVGAALPKKQMEDFIKLGSMNPEQTFNLYALGYDAPQLEEANRAAGSPINILEPVQPAGMPAEYKKHRWLVYTGSFELGTVGWPMAVAEAQAAGVGVCMPNLRPDVIDYVGAGGILYDSIEEVSDVIRGPVPADMRAAGFEQAKKSDIASHLHLLTDLWDRSAKKVKSPGV